MTLEAESHMRHVVSVSSVHTQWRRTQTMNRATFVWPRLFFISSWEIWPCCNFQKVSARSVAAGPTSVSISCADRQSAKSPPCTCAPEGSAVRAGTLAPGAGRSWRPAGVLTAAAALLRGLAHVLPFASLFTSRGWGRSKNPAEPGSHHLEVPVDLGAGTWVLTAHVPATLSVAVGRRPDAVP